MHSVVQSVRLLGVEASAIKAWDYEISRSPVRFLGAKGSNSLEAQLGRPGWCGHLDS